MNGCRNLLLLGLPLILLILLSVSYFPIKGQQQTRLWRAIYRGEPVWLKVPAELGDEVSQQSKAPDKLDNGKDKKIMDVEYELHSVLPTWYSAHFMDNGRGWVAGSAITRANFFSVPGGAILATTLNSGQSWAVQRVLEYDHLRSVFFIDPLNGWVAGSDMHNDRAIGVVAKTSDGGKSWLPMLRLDDYELSALHDIRFIDNKTGWAVGEAQINGEVQGLVIATRDGGRSWSRQYLRDRTYVLERAKFADKKRGWVVGARVILQTEDGGHSWHERWFEEGEYLFDIIALNSDELLAVGAGGLILHTLDGGRVWRKIDLPSEYKSTWLSCIYFKNAQRGWVAGNKGTIFATEDGGKSWHLESSGESSYLRSFATTNGRLIAVGNDGMILERKID
jgi:photosystem II stability/assembly factor-like uncharacterized protein